ncbi:hypothetical protein [Mycobacterium hubeiense]|uniref:hypothetical protein n=1 Tax=Mycobacterium hubeiense TaxID=1867256 RepID=UPI000C7EAF49|nr:hypothetical protein [Mycobacterium sp. QGD 101]
MTQHLEEYANPDRDIPLAPQVQTGIKHSYTVRQIVDALAATTPSRIIDESALSTSLAAKRSARGESGAPYAPPARKPPMSGSELALLASLPVTWGLSTVAVVTDVLPTPAVIAVIALTVALTAVALILGRYPQLRPSHRRALDGYTAAEHAELSRAVADWPGRARLSTYVNADTLQGQWDQRWKWASQPGAAAAVWREPHLGGIATLIAADIRASTAWNSELFDTHRVRIDLDATLRDIRSRAHRIWRISADTAVPTDTTGPAADRHREITTAIDEAWDRLVGLVVELDQYCTQLAPIDALVTEINALQLSAERVSDDALRQLHIDAVGSDLKRDTIANSAAELAELTANLNGRLEVLRGALHQPSSVLALVR